MWLLKIINKMKTKTLFWCITLLSMLICIVYYNTSFLSIMPLAFWLFVVIVDVLLFSITIRKPFSSLPTKNKIILIISFIIVGAIKTYFVINWINKDFFI
jgi:hypothetical protein